MTEKSIQVNVEKIREILDKNNGARIRTWLSICSRCGLCAESCLFYLANDRNPRFAPAYKVQRTLGTIYKKKGKVTPEFLMECYDIAWGECTTCKRCSLFCPFGIDIASMISLVRTICYSQGLVPEGLARTLPNYEKFGNQMAVSKEDLIETCEWMVEEAADYVKGVTIPLDVAGARYMYTINPREVMFYPQDLGMAAQIFTVAGESWTIPTSGWDSTNLAMFAGANELAGAVADRMYKKALELGVEAILITECGHAMRSAGYEGPYLAGYRNGRPPVPVVHSVQLFYEYLRDGKIQIDPAKRIDAPVTYQDPCNVSRNAGLWEQGREILKFVCNDFRDMSPNRHYNHCCGGGGGFIPMGGPFRKRRLRAGRVKAEQIRKTGAKIVVTPCHNCYDQLNDLNKEYDLGVRIVSLKELLVETMIVPDHLKPDSAGDERQEG
ncbi:MAG TPA: (Fe-S)-binding protein [Thermodesulforhabdus norvegica]|uniref:(Fe-S)-binding protein n=1 Tax=Thermodesulforhabdus norvegica TaxID=39841 RepID=A0A7C1AZ58_9BACT|nr:(Fe-S)-binding protein [Thermodesulforhabdus norvegica]